MRTLLMVATVVSLAACSTNPNKISAAYVSSANYTQYNCQQLAMESANIERRVNVVYASMKHENKKDKWAMGIGMVLFWPALFALSGGNDAQGVELAQMKGEYEAVQSAQVSKSCMVAGQAVQAVPYTRESPPSAGPVQPTVAAIPSSVTAAQPCVDTTQSNAYASQSDVKAIQTSNYSPQSNMPKTKPSRLRNGETVVIGHN